MGNIPATDDCMALAWIGSAGVRQMVGYTVPTWYGYAGWGVLDYFIEQPGRFTLQESWLANDHALGLETRDHGSKAAGGSARAGQHEGTWRWRRAPA